MASIVWSCRFFAVMNFLTCSYSWAMGNLGRAGYGASLDGTWPYSYDACDVGTVANQTKNGLPLA